MNLKINTSIGSLNMIPYLHLDKLNQTNIFDENLSSICKNKNDKETITFRSDYPSSYFSNSQIMFNNTNSNIKLLDK